MLLMKFLHLRTHDMNRNMQILTEERTVISVSFRSVSVYFRG